MTRAGAQSQNRQAAARARRRGDQKRL